MPTPGKYLQTVYQGNDDRVFRSFTHMTEEDALVTEANRLRLYAEWSRFWDVSKPVLLEKSPQHVPIVRCGNLRACWIKHTDCMQVSASHVYTFTLDVSCGAATSTGDIQAKSHPTQLW